MNVLNQERRNLLGVREPDLPCAVLLHQMRQIDGNELCLEHPVGPVRWRHMDEIKGHHLEVLGTW